MAPITKPFLLCVCVPVWIDDGGRRWTDEFWAKDLALHLDYLANLTIACPSLEKAPGPQDVCISDPPFDRIRFVDLPYPRSYAEGIWTFPRYLARLWSATRRASIVQSGFGGWPVAAGWFLAPMGKFQHKLVVMNVESSFWRNRGENVGPGQRVIAFVMDRLTRHAVRIADLRLFTSGAYAVDFLGEHAPRSFVVPATWIDEDWILTDEDARTGWDAKAGPIRLLFAGRLIAVKGVSVLIDAIDQAGQAGAELQVTIIGDGPMREECISAARRDHGSVVLEFRDPVPYGRPFLNLLRGYDAALLPSLSDEQPRLLFDAFSQAVPVIGSDTGGLRDLVEPGLTGVLVPAGKASALADALIHAAANRAKLRAMGIAALAKAARPNSPRDASEKARDLAAIAWRVRDERGGFLRLGIMSQEHTA